MALLKAQAEKLLLQSEPSSKWASSVYGKVISFLDQETLHKIRGFWTKYAANAARNVDARKKFETNVRRDIKKARDKSQGYCMKIQGLRSVGPNWTGASGIISTCFNGFWETGVVAGNLQDVKELESSQGGHVNPMFAISSSSTEDFAVHYGSDPLIGFHLATAFDREIPSEVEQKKLVVQVAKSQFRDWCNAFQGQVKLGAVEVKIFWGDALRFCYELQACKTQDNISQSLSRPMAISRNVS
jgi:hypothetical protein